MKLSKELEDLIKKDDVEKTSDFICNNSDGVAYQMLHGSGHKCFNHLFDKSEHGKIAEAIKVFAEIENLVHKHGNEF